jgi:hypothetical protein
MLRNTVGKRFHDLTDVKFALAALAEAGAPLNPMESADSGLPI